MSGPSLLTLSPPLPPPPSSPSLTQSKTTTLSPPPPPSKSISLLPHSKFTRKIHPSYRIYRRPALLLLKQCESTAQVHRIMPLIYKNGFHNHPIFQTKLVSLFCSFNSLEDAARVFESIPVEEKLDVLYRTMLKGYAQVGRLDDGLEFLCRMKRDGVEMDGYDYSYLLKACGEGFELKRGREIHGSLVVNGYGFDLVVMTCAVSMYAKCGSVEDAYKAFDRMPVRDSVAWNAIIAGYAQNGYAKVALELMIRMQEERKRPDWITVVSALPACADMCSAVLGKSVHGYAMRAGFDSFLNVWTALMDMYSKFGAVKIARSIFDGLDGKRTVITWNCMIDGYIQNGDPEEALRLFRRMLDEGIEPTNVTIIEALHACTDCGDLKSGKFIHELSDQMDLGSDIQNGHVKEALTYLREMFVGRIKIDCFTLGGIIPALAEFPSPRRARWVHGLAVRTYSDQNLFVFTALVDMYAKCGDLQTARKLFDTRGKKHVMTWNVMIDAYGTHGLAASAIELFSEMQMGPMKPDETTFLCILSACSHSGLVKEGRLYFGMMREEYCLEPANEHHGAMVDLLGQAGLLDDAWDIIGSMPSKPGIGVLGSMLSACKMHKNVELGERVWNMLVDLDPHGGGYHMLLANMYCKSLVWDKVAALRSEMDDTELWRVLESSFMELGNESHTFNSGRADLLQIKGNFRLSAYNARKIKAVDTSSMHHDDDQDSVQEQLISSHSEMLAIASGFWIPTPAECPYSLGKTYAFVRIATMLPTPAPVLDILDWVEPYDSPVVCRIDLMMRNRLGDASNDLNTKNQEKVISWDIEVHISDVRSDVQNDQVISMCQKGACQSTTKRSMNEKISTPSPTTCISDCSRPSSNLELVSVRLCSRSDSANLEADWFEVVRGLMGVPQVAIGDVGGWGRSARLSPRQLPPRRISLRSSLHNPCLTCTDIRCWLRSALTLSLEG
ncbi:Pentatricopeptide repeat-containing protein, partial [Drosera capensis]